MESYDHGNVSSLGTCNLFAWRGARLNVSKNVLEALKMHIQGVDENSRYEEA